jgi:uncharacterized protein
MKTDTYKLLAGLGLAVALVGGAGIALAQSADTLSAALAAGKIGEQADGYLGIRSAVSESVKDHLDAINIQRRSIYTQRAAQKGATVKEMAAAVGCDTLANNVDTGRAYLLPDGIWRVKSTAPIKLPAYCPA